jgi:hypothetical protein
MAKKDLKQEMTIEEARAYRASLHKPQKNKLSEQEKRNQFRLFWAQSRKKYGKPKKLEEILWLHLAGTGHDEPEKFEAGIKHFGLKKIG